MTTKTDDLFGPVIFSYTRQNAIDDGVLVDITDKAKEYGFKVPVCITSTLYDGYVKIGEEFSGQSTEGRLHDVLSLASIWATKRRDDDRITFDCAFLMPDGHKEVLNIIVHVGPGDEGEPVVTIMLPEDD